MIHYAISVKSPATQYIKIDLWFEADPARPTEVCLPYWRPGRYEAGLFAANVKDVECDDSSGTRVAVRKISRDRWQIASGHSGSLHLSYLYYAATLNAGSTYVDDHQLYVNPVNCLMFLPDRRDESCEVKFLISDNWKVATALREREKHVFRARTYDELADSPFIASPQLKATFFEVAGLRFDLWFQGECKPDLNRLRKDLSLVIREQLELFKTFPTDRYHFLFQILPYRYRHGVEHISSTVIAFGPGYALMTPDVYEDFLALCSHEFFHIWNVKTIRPADFLPYDYTRENYSELGYVYEGVTTYYGDLLALRAGVMREATFLKELEEWIRRYAHNYGRRSQSVAQASWDTWLDGYRESAPHRKVSIYNEGALLALCLDFIIRRNTEGAASLDDVLRRMNEEFGNLKKGYTRHDYKRILETTSGEKLDEFFARYIEGTDTYLDLLNTLLPLAGLQIRTVENPVICERDFGFKVSSGNSRTVVTVTAPGSLAESAGLMPGDEIKAVNGYRIEGNLNEWLGYFSDERVELLVLSGNTYRKIGLFRGPDRFYPLFQIHKVERPSPEQVKFYESWTRQPF